MTALPPTPCDRPVALLQSDECVLFTCAGKRRANVAETLALERTKGALDYKNRGSRNEG